MAADQARARVASTIGEAAFAAPKAAWRSVAREQPVWEAEVVPLSVPTHEDPDGADSLVMVTAGGFVVHAHVLPSRPAGPAERGRAIADAVAAAGKELDVLPGRLHVRDVGLAEALAGSLAPHGIEVAVAELDSVDEALDTAIEHLAGSPIPSRMTTPAAWRETEASPQELEQFHQAAAEFYTAAPWEGVDEEGPLLLEFADGSTWVASTMGAGGREFGLVLNAELEDLLDMLSLPSPAEALQRMRGYSLTADFDRRRELAGGLRREVAAAGWPIAGPRAYPRLFGVNLPERRVLASHVRTMTTALAAVACTAREEDPELATGVRVSIIPLDEED